jgi:riboflavin-specific deaminase-like protein
MKGIPPLTERRLLGLARSLEELIQAKYLKTGLPFVTVKYAQTLDGKIATVTGDSKWISGPCSLRLAHCMRSCHDAVLVGVGTIIRDDPRLTVRLLKGRDPRKVVLDTALRTPLHSRILKGPAANQTTIVATSLRDREKVQRIRSEGARVWRIRGDRSDRVDLKILLQKLARNGIRSLLVEGGSDIITSFLRRQLADHVLVAIAPKIVGKGLYSIGAGGLAARYPLSSARYLAAGEDLIVQCYIHR